jgi:hypothetical protein
MPVIDRSGSKQRVSRRAGEIFFRPCGEQRLTILDNQVAVGRRDVNNGMLKRLFVHGVLNSP